MADDFFDSLSLDGVLQGSRFPSTSNRQRPWSSYTARGDSNGSPSRHGGAFTRPVSASPLLSGTRDEPSSVLLPVSARAGNGRPRTPGPMTGPLDTRRKVHVQSVMKKSKEQLAEEFVKAKNKLHEMVEENKMLLAEKRRFQAQIAVAQNNVNKAEELLNNKGRSMGATQGLSQMYRNPETTAIVANLKERVQRVSAERNKLQEELNALKLSTRATRVSELHSECEAFSEELQRITSINQTLMKRIGIAEQAAAAASEQSKQAVQKLKEYMSAGNGLVAAPPRLTTSGSLSKAHFMATIRVLQACHANFQSQAQLISGLFPRHLSGWRELDQRATSNLATYGSGDVLRFLRAHLQTLTQELQDLPGARLSLDSKTLENPLFDQLQELLLRLQMQPHDRDTRAAELEPLAQICLMVAMEIQDQNSGPATSQKARPRKRDKAPSSDGQGSVEDNMSMYDKLLRKINTNTKEVADEGTAHQNGKPRRKEVGPRRKEDGPRRGEDEPQREVAEPRGDSTKPQKERAEPRGADEVQKASAPLRVEVMGHTQPRPPPHPPQSTISDVEVPLSYEQQQQLWQQLDGGAPGPSAQSPQMMVYVQSPKKISDGTTQTEAERVAVEAIEAQKEEKQAAAPVSDQADHRGEDDGGGPASAGAEEEEQAAAPVREQVDRGREDEGERSASLRAQEETSDEKEKEEEEAAEVPRPREDAGPLTVVPAPPESEHVQQEAVPPPGDAGSPPTNQSVGPSHQAQPPQPRPPPSPHGLASFPTSQMSGETEEFTTEDWQESLSDIRIFSSGKKGQGNAYPAGEQSDVSSGPWNAPAKDSSTLENSSGTKAGLSQAEGSSSITAGMDSVPDVPMAGGMGGPRERGPEPAVPKVAHHGLLRVHEDEAPSAQQQQQQEQQHEEDSAGVGDAQPADRGGGAGTEGGTVRQSSDAAGDGARASRTASGSGGSRGEGMREGDAGGKDTERSSAGSSRRGSMRAASGRNEPGRAAHAEGDFAQQDDGSRRGGQGEGDGSEVRENDDEEEEEEIGEEIQQAGDGGVLEEKQQDGNEEREGKGEEEISQQGQIEDGQDHDHASHQTVGDGEKSEGGVSSAAAPSGAAGLSSESGDESDGIETEDGIDDDEDLEGMEVRGLYDHASGNPSF